MTRAGGSCHEDLGARLGQSCADGSLPAVLNSRACSASSRVAIRLDALVALNEWWWKMVSSEDVANSER